MTTNFVHLTDLHISAPELKDRALLSDTVATLKTIIAMVQGIEPRPAFVVVSGDLTADSSTPGGESPNAIFNVDPSNSEVGLPERQLVISLPVASVHSDGARLNLTLYIAEGGGAGAMIKAEGMTPDQYGVRALLLPLIEGNFLEVSDPNILAVSGDMRVLENGDRLTAAFDFTITNGQTNQTVRVVGRVNGLSLS